MPKTKAPKHPIDHTPRFEELASRLHDYSTGIYFVGWLVDNHLLPPDTDPAQLAYEYAIFHSQYREELDRIISKRN